ncbi:MAG: hypothetical protein KGJ23_06720 [Euryarchaeota archaeon]|nr:hypothetical protein [Euryarchaeota archaeon]MDE1836292.1 hypothetical protein [Euryarchaeota archaeon]MDE2044312.1 hypothetical protein [Thermoplasmata archaeon]
MPGGSERILQGWVRELDQARLDAWMKGEISVRDRVSELLGRYGKLAKSSKWALLRWVKDLDGPGVYRWIHEKRPDLRLGDEEETCRRIDADLQAVRKLLEEL